MAIVKLPKLWVEPVDFLTEARKDLPAELIFDGISVDVRRGQCAHVARHL